MKNQLRTLLVEDNPGDADLIREMLADTIGLNLKIEGVSSLAEARSQLGEKDFDLILLDLGLPDSSGLDTLRSVRETAANIPIVVLTGNDDEKAGIAAVKEGAQDYLIKGQIPDYLLSRVLFFALERHQINAKVRHLNKILRAIRNINQLIVSEKDRDLLLKKACACLVEDRSYNHAWIVTQDQGGDFTGFYEQNIGTGFDKFKEHLRSGKTLWCISQAINSASAVVIKDVKRICGDCPLIRLDRSHQAVAVRLEHDAKIFGVLTVAVSKDEKITSEETGLLEEAAHDIALALHGIEQSEMRERADKQIQFLSSIVEQSVEGMAIADMEGDLLFANQAWVKMHGYNNVEELLGKNLSISHTDEQVKNEVEPFNKIVIEKGYNQGEIGHVRKDGSIFPTLMTTTLIKDENGNPIAIAGVATDITERKQAEEALRSEKSFTDQLLNTAQTIFLVLNPQGKIISINSYFEEISGYRSEEVVGKDWFTTFLPKRDRESLRVLFLKAIGDIQTSGNANPIITKDGRERLVEWYDKTIKNSEGEVVGLLSTGQDTTERVQAEEALLKSKAHLSNALRIARLGHWEYDVTKDLFTFTDEFYDVFRTSAEEMGGYTMSSARYAELFVHPGDAALVGEEIRKALETDDPDYSVQLEHRVIFAGGQAGYITVRFNIVKDSKGRTIRTYGANQDITERKLAEQALFDSEAKFRSLIEQSGDAIYLLHEGRFEIINRKFTEILGYTADEINREEFNFLDLVAPESRGIIIERGEKQKRGEKFDTQYEFTALAKDGREIEVEASVAYIDYKGGRAVQGILRDVSERKRLEEQFHQAQKMEAVGRLAGGVAHDFNNLLTVIGGNASLAEMSLGKDDPLHIEIEQIQKASARAAKLTGQLLAFSRKQTVQPKVLDLNEIVHDMEKMLHRLIREDIKIQFTLGQDTGVIKADQGQMEQIIANLTVNARDAMPEGGEIKISTRRVVVDEDCKDFDFEIVPGVYAELSVSDTGCGMTEEVKKKIFEPFFTTKELGKGTGLGLSTVFGIVKQSKGYVLVDSEVGKGAAFRILLPQSRESSETKSEKSAFTKVLTGNEGILIVEDEESVRIIAERALKKFGYNIVLAKDGIEALRQFEHDPSEFDLIITDMVMPGIRGNKLVEIIREKFNPDIKALFISGYIPEDEDSGLVLEAKIPFLQKPFDPMVLARVVRKVLDS